MHLKKCNGIILARVVMMEERQEAQSMRSLAAGAASSRVPAEAGEHHGLRAKSPSTHDKCPEPEWGSADMNQVLHSPWSVLSADSCPAGCNRTPRATAGLQGAQLPPSAAAPWPDQPILQSGSTKTSSRRGLAGTWNRARHTWQPRFDPRPFVHSNFNVCELVL